MSVIALEEAKLYLKIDTNDDDVLITSLISAAEQTIERFTGRKLLISDFRYVLDDAENEIIIPFSPLQEITKIEVVAEDGTVSEVDSSIYDVDLSPDQLGRIKLKPEYSWPDHRGFASFIISGKAGYGTDASSVPAPLKTAILIALAILYENRGQVESQTLIDSISGLCWPYRVLRV